MRIAAATIASAIFIASASPAVTAAQGAKPRLLLLIEHRAEDKDAAEQVGPIAEAMLARRGFEIAARRDSPANPGDLDAMRAETQANLVITLSIRFHLDARPRSQGAAASPAIGLVAALSDGDKVVWHNAIGLIADGQAPPEGPATALSASACRRLFWTLPAPLGPTDLEDEIRKGPQEAAPSYDVTLYRLRTRRGPRFPLRIERRQTP